MALTFDRIRLGSSRLSCCRLADSHAVVFPCNPER